MAQEEAQDLKLCKTLVSFKGDETGDLYRADTIWHDGAWWLVGSWLQSNATGERVPEKLVLLSGLRFQEVNLPDYRFALNSPLPKSVLDGQPQAGYVLATYPALAHMQGPKKTQ